MRGGKQVTSAHDTSLHAPVIGSQANPVSQVFSWQLGTQPPAVSSHRSPAGQWTFALQKPMHWPEVASHVWPTPGRRLR